mgnify:CR=1 FL=1
MNQQFEELLKQHDEDGNRFGKQLAKLAFENNAKVIVETGYGVSTLFLLAGTHHECKVYSIDPAPWATFRIDNPRSELILERSTDAMAALYKRTGPWDIFLHDSNHDIKCMTYELSLAYALLRPGGYICCDDYTWGGHKAWDKFVAEEGLVQQVMGSIMIARKPFSGAHPISPDSRVGVDAYAKACLEDAETAEAEWLAAGNKNSDITWDNKKGVKGE